jgi:glycine oxidase
MAEVSSAEVLVVGAGIIGCSIAYQCAVAGLRVLVLEQQRIGDGASGAAAGMLAPQVEAHQPDAFFRLLLAGRAMHGELAAQLQEETGIDVGYRRSGVLRVALEEREAVDLRNRAEWQRGLGLAAEWVESRQLVHHEPMFAGAAGRKLIGALWLSEEGQVHGGRLVQALAAAAQTRGALFQETTPVIGFERAGRRVIGVRTPDGIHRAATVVLASGAWSGELAKQAGLAVPVEPIKGQAMALRMGTDRPQHIIWSRDCYLVPKVDGRLIVGATEQRAGFDTQPILSGLVHLANGAVDLLPALGRLPVDGLWAGLRPATPDRFPIIGWATDAEGLLLATGHFRHGIILGPLTGHLVAQLLQGKTTDWDLAPYAPARFAAVPAG